MAKPRARPEPELIRLAELARRSAVPTGTIKFYLREGLLPRSRHKPSRNVALYDARLADRVRAIKQLQRECFLPLDHIAKLLEPAPSAALRKDLDAAQRRRLASLTPAIQAGAQVARQRRGADHGSRTRHAVLTWLQITEADLALLESLDLLHAVGPRARYTGSDLELLEVIDEARRQGLGDLFPMEILAPYAARLRELAVFELDLFRRRVLGGARLPDLPLDDIAEAATMLGERLVVAMRQRLVSGELAKLRRG